MSSAQIAAVAPVHVYERALARPHLPLVLRERTGEGKICAVGRWLSDASPTDERILRGASGPVLDVGCGPGRHLQELRRLGIEGVGIDSSLGALAKARARGVRVRHGSIFELPDTGERWQTILLLDGNIGIGGSPERLLRTLSPMLAVDGRILVELSEYEQEPLIGYMAEPERLVRLEIAGQTSAWFPWADVTADAITQHAVQSGLVVQRVWTDNGRRFCWIGRDELVAKSGVS